MRVACLWFDTPVSTVKIAESCLRLSPQICFRENHAVFIEIGKCAKLYSEETFRLRIAVLLRRLGLTAHVAIGNDIPDALVMAKYRVSQTDRLPLEALTYLADPFGKDIVMTKFVQKLIASFGDLGIQTLAQFKRLPASELSSRFGKVGIFCHQRLKGEVSIPWPHWKPEEIVTERSDFPYFDFYGELDQITFELKKHLDQIFQRLRARGLKALKIQVQIFTETNSRNREACRSFDFDFLFPQSATKGALNVIRERLAKDFEKKPIRTPVEGIETTVLEKVIGSHGQKNLFHNHDEMAEQVHSLLNQLAEECGRENVFQAELTGERRPERSWKKSFGQAHGPIKDPISIEGIIPMRPTHLMRPERVQVTAGYIHIRKERLRVHRWSESVEKISGGWIENDPFDEIKNRFDRTYFQAEVEGGRLVWLFETPHHEFFIHGYYG